MHDLPWNIQLDERSCLLWKSFSHAPTSFGAEYPSIVQAFLSSLRQDRCYSSTAYWCPTANHQRTVRSVSSLLELERLLVILTLVMFSPSRAAEAQKQDYRTWIFLHSWDKLLWPFFALSSQHLFVSLQFQSCNRILLRNTCLITQEESIRPWNYPDMKYTRKGRTWLANSMCSLYPSVSVDFAAEERKWVRNRILREGFWWSSLRYLPSITLCLAHGYAKPCNQDEIYPVFFSVWPLLLNILSRGNNHSRFQTAVRTVYSTHWTLVVWLIDVQTTEHRRKYLLCMPWQTRLRLRRPSIVEDCFHCVNKLWAWIFQSRGRDANLAKLSGGSLPIIGSVLTQGTMQGEVVCRLLKFASLMKDVHGSVSVPAIQKV